MRPTCVLLVAMLTCQPAAAAALFEDTAVLNARLTGPIASLVDELDPESERGFTLQVGDAAHAVKVRVRGNSRLRVCEFPPLRLNFRRSEPAGSPFDGQDKLKLVTHCRNSSTGEQDLLEEYLAYRILNVLTDVSFRVRLLRLQYVDEPAGDGPAEFAIRHAFVLESDEALARRLGGKAVTLPGVPKRRYDRQHAALVFVFQYLIANTDWSFVRAEYDAGCCHNITLVDVDDVLLTVPYDFDLAGIVNARYAFPDPFLRIDRVRQRLYRGICMDRETLSQALDTVLARQPQIMAAVSTTPALAARGAEQSGRFLQGFFERAADRERLLQRFERDCL